MKLESNGNFDSVALAFKHLGDPEEVRTSWEIGDRLCTSTSVPTSVNNYPVAYLSSEVYSIIMRSGRV